MRPLIYATIIAFLLSACSVPTVTDTKIASYAPVTIPTVQPVSIKPVTVNIDSNGNAVIPPDSFKNLELDIADATRWMRQEAAVVGMLTGIVNERSTSTVKK